MQCPDPRLWPVKNSSKLSTDASTNGSHGDASAVTSSQLTAMQDRLDILETQAERDQDRFVSLERQVESERQEFASWQDTFAGWEQTFTGWMEQATAERERHKDQFASWQATFAGWQRHRSAQPMNEADDFSYRWWSSAPIYLEKDRLQIKGCK